MSLFNCCCLSLSPETEVFLYSKPKTSDLQPTVLRFSSFLVCLRRFLPSTLNDFVQNIKATKIEYDVLKPS